MNKKIALIVTGFVLTGMLALKFIPASGTSNTSNTVGLTDMILSTTGRNPELNLINEKIRLAEKKYNRALDEKNEDGANDVETAKREEVYPMKKELEVNNLKWERDNKQDELVADVKKLYYEILVKQEVIDVQKNKILRLNKQLEDVKRQIELGTMPKNTLINYELDLDKAQNELKKLQHQEESLMMDLNMKSGNDVNNKLVLKKEEIPEVKLDINLPNIIKDLQKNSYEVKALEKQIRIKVQEKNIVDLNADDDVPIEGIKYKDDVVEDLKDEIVQVEYDIEDKKTDLEFKVRNDYNNILKIKDDMESKSLDYDKNLKLLDTAKTKYELGLTTDKEYKAAEEECKKALCAYEQSKIDYYIAAEKFKDFIQ